MDTIEKSEEKQEEEKYPSNASLEEEQYKVFDYCKEHPGLLVTCVSALVAIISFLLHYAVGRMNYAYLEYWNIASIHANSDNQNEIYMIVFSLVYMLSLMLVHGLLSRTSDVFRYYNRLLSIMKRVIKEAKKLDKRLRKNVRILSRKLKKYPSQYKGDDIDKEIKKDIEETNILLKKGSTDIQDLEIERGKLRRWVTVQIVIAVVVSYVIGSLFLSLSTGTVTIKESLRLSWVIIIIILCDMAVYFLPAYLATRCSKKEFESKKAAGIVKKMLDRDVPEFPFEKVISVEMNKSVLSDKKIKMIAVQFVALTVSLLFMMPIIGKVNAEQKRNFPIYTDGATSYAILYFNESTVFMEEVVIQDKTIMIDATKQRIVTTDDICYDIIVFDSVTVNKLEDTYNQKQKSFSVRDVIDAVGQVLDVVKSKIWESVNQNNG